MLGTSLLPLLLRWPAAAAATRPAAPSHWMAADVKFHLLPPCPSLLSRFLACAPALEACETSRAGPSARLLHAHIDFVAKDGVPGLRACESVVARAASHCSCYNASRARCCRPRAHLCANGASLHLQYRIPSSASSTVTIRHKSPGLPLCLIDRPSEGTLNQTSQAAFRGVSCRRSLSRRAHLTSSPRPPFEMRAPIGAGKVPPSAHRLSSALGGFAGRRSPRKSAAEHESPGASSPSAQRASQSPAPLLAPRLRNGRLCTRSKPGVPGPKSSCKTMRGVPPGLRDSRVATSRSTNLDRASGVCRVPCL